MFDLPLSGLFLAACGESWGNSQRRLLAVPEVMTALPPGYSRRIRIVTLKL